MIDPNNFSINGIYVLTYTYMYMYMYMYIYIYIYIHTHTHTYIYIYTYIYFFRKRVLLTGYQRVKLRNGRKLLKEKGVGSGIL
jgi:hypothetical protein